MKKWISSLSIFLGIILLFNFPIGAEQSYSWYCVRNREHKQPRADAQVRFVEEYDGYYVDFKHGDTSEDKVLYLTFDAGYENGNVAKILDILKEEQVTGAFFVLGNLIQRNPELIKRMTNEGHTVANHTTNHKDITKYTSIDEMKRDLEELEALYQEVTGAQMPKYFRPPEGKFNERSMQMSQALGYQTIFWSIAYADWDNSKQMDEEKLGLARSVICV